eukprot:gnl/Chilomastix_cuspidata/4040.p1 GENE.gnl/Chilomastix_cuspidata/4040~~gnl/Chilomastix_cuspidata/4040.p1  ORF type:complete len:369 (-),score=116.55 gnl/Chilomastix_cuspidata/4040:43-1128(-)
MIRTEPMSADKKNPYGRSQLASFDMNLASTFSQLNLKYVPGAVQTRNRQFSSQAARKMQQKRTLRRKGGFRVPGSRRQKPSHTEFVTIDYGSSKMSSVPDFSGMQLPKELVSSPVSQRSPRTGAITEVSGFYPTSLPFDNSLETAGGPVLRLLGTHGASAVEVEASMAKDPVAKPDSYSAPPPHAAHELITESDGSLPYEARLFFMQFPSLLPFKAAAKPRPTPEEPAPKPPLATDAPKPALAPKVAPKPTPKPAPKPAPRPQRQQDDRFFPLLKTSTLEQLPSGYFGKLRIHRSGRMTILTPNGIVLEVTPGSHCNFVQEAYVMDTEQKTIHSLGSITQKAVVSPDMPSLLAMARAPATK